MHQDAMNMVRSGLRARIDALAAQGGTIALPNICEQIDRIRHDACAYGLEPVARIASTLETALARNGLGARAPHLQMPLTPARLWELMQPGH